MIVDERMVSFINSLDAGNPPYLNELEEYARATDVPIVRTEMQSFLRFLMKMKQPMRILEVGTAIGFSALLMSEYAPQGCKITTIEKYEKRIPLAKENFAKAGKAEDITLLEGDALEILPTLTEEYDFIFMDAAKGQYMNFLPYLMKLLPEGGILITDNVLQEGTIVESKYTIPRRERTIHMRMREYVYTLKHMEELETVVLPVGDGVTLSVKRG